MSNNRSGFVQINKRKKYPEKIVEAVNKKIKVYRELGKPPRFVILSELSALRLMHEVNEVVVLPNRKNQKPEKFLGLQVVIIPTTTHDIIEMGF